MSDQEIWDLTKKLRNLERRVESLEVPSQSDEVRELKTQLQWAEEACKIWKNAADKFEGDLQGAETTIEFLQESRLTDAVRLRMAEKECDRLREIVAREEDKVTKMSRWEVGFRNVVYHLVGSHAGFEIKDIVDQVEKLVAKVKMYEVIPPLTESPITDEERKLLKEFGDEDEHVWGDDCFEDDGCLG